VVLVVVEADPPEPAELVAVALATEKSPTPFPVTSPEAVSWAKV